MHAITPIVADAIDIPLVLLAGIIVLVPLIAFEVFVEALVLKKVWDLPYWSLCGFTFFANIWSLLAGIPTKIFNAFLYAHLLPADIPGFFARYPFAIALGSFIYFGVTILVEGAYAFRWRRRKQLGLGRGRIWRGVLLANLATYVVLAPLNYFATRPFTQIQQFTNDTRWTAHPTQTVLFVDSSDRYLKSVHLDGSKLKVIVPAPMADYLVSSNLAVCLFRGTNGDLYIYNRGQKQPTLVWKTDERFFMNQVAFSPSGDLVAFASENSNSVEVVDVQTGKRMQAPLVQKFSFDGASVAWSPEESKFYVGGFEKTFRLVISIETNSILLALPLPGTNAPPLLTCYGRVSDSRWWGGGDWGVSFNRDTCNDLTAMAWPGLDSSLRIERSDHQNESPILTVSVRPGLLHLADFYFGDVAFLPGGRECLFESNGYIYLLDINEKRLGTLVRGNRFIQLTPRFEKSL